MLQLQEILFPQCELLHVMGMCFSSASLQFLFFSRGFFAAISPNDWFILKSFINTHFLLSKPLFHRFVFPPSVCLEYFPLSFTVAFLYSDCFWFCHLNISKSFAQLRAIPVFDIFQFLCFSLSSYTLTSSCFYVAALQPLLLLCIYEWNVDINVKLTCSCSQPPHTVYFTWTFMLIRPVDLNNALP